MRSYIDQSFGSFVNPTESDVEADNPFEIVYRNQTFHKMLDKKEKENVKDLIVKPMFQNIYD